MEKVRLGDIGTIITGNTPSKKKLEYYINKSIATTNSDEYCKLKLDINRNNKCDNCRVIDDRPNI